MTVPGMFIPKATTVRVWCDITDKVTGEKPYEGLWADVRRNLTNGERMEFVEASRAIDVEGEALTTTRHEQHAAYLKAMTEADGDADRQRALIAQEIAEADAFYTAAQTQMVARFELLAPHVHAWNVFEIDEQGEPVPVPPPRDGGAAVLVSINNEIVRWLLDSTIQAYRMGFAIGSRTSGAQPEPTPGPSAEKPNASTSSSRPSRKRSSSLKASTFEA